MNYSDYRFTLDVQIHQAQVSVPVSLNDTARKLCIGLTDGRKPYTIADGCIASFVARKPDGTKLHNYCVIERNTVIYEFTPQTTNVEGVVNCEIRLQKDGVLLVSPQFTIVVDKQVVRDDEIVPSADQYTSITNMLNAETARAEAETARAIGEVVRANAEYSRNENETERINAEEARDAAEKDRVLDHKYIIDAEAARVAAENARVVAENDRDTDEYNREQNEMARVTAENARIAAETARVEAETARAEALKFHCGNYSLPTIYFEGDITAMNKDNAVTLNYTYGERSGTCTLKWQGSSSLAYPKKNYTVKFDNAFEAVSGWGEQKKYCLKADWVDFSHCRNVVSAKLWGGVVRSRATSDLVTRLSALPNCGAIDGFPCFVVINGEWQGIFNFNIPKDGWMMGMGSGEKEAILCCEGVGGKAEIFQAEATLGVDFELEYASEGWAESDIQASLNRMITACMNSDGTDIDTVLAQYVDIDSAIDYIIFDQFLYNHDGIRKNYILATYDGVKWFFSAYDMDNVFGQHFPGTYFLSAKEPHDAARSNKLFKLLIDNKLKEITQRCRELLGDAMSAEAVALKFTNYAAPIPLPAFNADAELWGIVPSTMVNNINQIITWYGDRVKMVEGECSKHETEMGTEGLTYDGIYCTGMGTCLEEDIIVKERNRATVTLITNIGASAFEGDAFIKSVTFNKRIQRINNYAFRGCTSLEKVIFSAKPLITNLTLLSEAFSGCTSLKVVKLPDVEIKLASGVFYNCTGLRKIYIPRVIEALKGSMFANCTSLTDIHYGGTMAEWEALTKVDGWNTNTGNYTVHCTDGNIAKA